MKRKYISFFGDIQFQEEETLPGLTLPERLSNATGFQEIWWNSESEGGCGAEYINHPEFGLCILEYSQYRGDVSTTIYYNCIRENLGVTPGEQVGLEDCPPLREIRADFE